MRVTQYWPDKSDPNTDSNTRNRIGFYDNPLTDCSCALTVDAQAYLNVKRGDLVIIDFGHGRVFKRYFHDRCPKYSEPRVDLFQVNGFDKSLPDYAFVRAA